MTNEEEIIVAKAICTLLGVAYNAYTVCALPPYPWNTSPWNTTNPDGIPAGWRVIPGNVNGILAACKSRGMLALGFPVYTTCKTGVLVTLEDYLKLTDLLEAIARVEPKASKGRP